MLSFTARKTQVTMGCGHQIWETLKYRGSNDLRAIKASYRMALCQECVSSIDRWLSLSGSSQTPFPVRLPEIRGQSDAQIRYGQAIRDKQFRELSPVMTQLVMEATELSLSLWRALLIHFMVSSASYWISNKEGFSSHQIHKMIIDVSKPSYSRANFAEKMKKGGFSSFDQLNFENPALLKRVMEHNPTGMFSKETA